MKDPKSRLIEVLDGASSPIEAHLLPAMVKFYEQLPNRRTARQHVGQDFVFRALDVHLQHINLSVAQSFHDGGQPADGRFNRWSSQAAARENAVGNEFGILGRVKHDVPVLAADTEIMKNKPRGQLLRLDPGNGSGRGIKCVHDRFKPSHQFQFKRDVRADSEGIDHAISVEPAWANAPLRVVIPEA